MPKKRSPIFQKVSNLLKISVLLAKMGKPIIPRLISLNTSSKLKKFRLQKHYNYGYIQEYEFSPSNTPLIHYPTKSSKKRLSLSDIYSILFLCRCVGRLRDDEGVDGISNFPLELEAFSAMEGDAVAIREPAESIDSGGEEDSVDERAERFIERFYEEIKLQRKRSFLQLK